MRKPSRIVLSTIMALTCIVSSLGVSVNPVMAATGDVEINSTNFSDQYFREYVKTFDTNGNGFLSQAEMDAVTAINISSNTTIEKLSGIENFKNLKKINAFQATKISSLDLSNNPNIEYLNFESVPLKSVNIEGCSKLTHLDLFDTDISFVDISSCPNLIYYDVAGTNMSYVNIINESSIISTYENNAAKPDKYNGVDYIGHGNYKSGYYFGYSSKSTVISSCPEGYIAYFLSEYVNSGMYDLFAKMDRNNDGLISKNERNFKGQINIIKLTSDAEKIFKDIPEISDIELARFEDKKFDGSYFPNLEAIDVFLNKNQLEEMDLSSNSNLKIVTILETPTLKSIDFSNNSKLEHVNLVNTCISTLNLGDNKELEYLLASNSEINSLDISGCPKLRRLIINNTNITEIDISKNPLLIDCYLNGTASEDSTGITYSLTKPDGTYYYLHVNAGTKVITNVPVSVIPNNPTIPTNPSTPVTPATPTTPVTPVPVTPATPVPETGLAGFIERLYNVALGRQSEAEGKNWWINKVKFENYTGSDVANGFLVSDEFLGKQMTNDQFLEVLYKTFFDRSSDANGKAYWLDLMNKGYSKQDVINGFCNSTEWANLCLTYGIPSGSSAAPTIVITPNEGTNAFVTRLYTTCLGRAPEQAGFEYWTYRLANMQERGSSAMVGFFTSTEFTSKGYDNATYVTLLYRTILGREPDQAGLNYWLSLMANGMSRNDVLNGFAASNEWADICSGYGILK